MNFRPISEQQARQVLKILTEECGYRVVDPRDGEAFVRAIVAPDGVERVCHEYRFCGALGFGGKFRNNGNHNNTPYVDCYPENLTNARRNMIAEANRRLADLFSTDNLSPSQQGSER